MTMEEIPVPRYETGERVYVCGARFTHFGLVAGRDFLSERTPSGWWYMIDFEPLEPFEPFPREHPERDVHSTTDPAPLFATGERVLFTAGPNELMGSVTAQLPFYCPPPLRWEYVVELDPGQALDGLRQVREEFMASLEPSCPPEVDACLAPVRRRLDAIENVQARRPEEITQAINGAVAFTARATLDTVEDMLANLAEQLRTELDLTEHPQIQSLLVNIGNLASSLANLENTVNTQFAEIQEILAVLQEAAPGNGDVPFLGRIGELLAFLENPVTFITEKARSVLIQEIIDGLNR